MKILRIKGLHHSICHFLLCLFGGISCQDSYDQTLIATPNAAYLTSPGYPTGYSNNLTYEWLIESQSIGEVVKISVEDCEIEFVNSKVPSCQLDFLRIYDGAYDNDTLLYDSCCMTSVPDMNSTSRYLLIRFVTDSTIVAKGFKIKYYNTGTATAADSALTSVASASILIVVGVVAALIVIGIFVVVFLIYKIKMKDKSTPRVNPVGGEESRIEQDSAHRSVRPPVDEYTKLPIAFPSGSPIPPPEIFTEPSGSRKLNSPRKTNLFDLKLPDVNTRGNSLPPVE